MQIYDFADLMHKERQHQADRFGDGNTNTLDREDDEKNSVSSFTAYIAKYAATWLPGTMPPFDGEEVLRAFQVSMVKVATLAYSAHRWAERKLQRAVSETPAPDDAEG